MLRKKNYSSIVFLTSLFFLVSFSSVSAQSPCGDFVVVEEWEGEVYEDRTPIEDCDNPFNEDTPAPFTVDFTISSQLVINGSTIAISPDEQTTISYQFHRDDPNYISETMHLYQKVGDDYLFVFDDYSKNLSINTLPEGEYLAVFELQETPVSTQAEPLWKQWLKGIFLPLTTYAFFPDYVEVITVPFTIEHEIPPPQGASSVLFLPGIQASRLYKKDFIGGGSDQVWPPNAAFDNDVYNLSMDTSGVSEEEIYTRDIIDTTEGAGDVYASFKIFLNQLDTEGVIENWKPFAYDWRYSVTDIAQNGTQYENEIRDAVDEIESLAASSFSGKVTIIGHSNGGLLAKAIMRRLENEGKADLIDKIIFLASPQLGTPKAIGTILHGYDQSDSFGGIVISAQGARTVMNNFPGAYGLLPPEKYFEGMDGPLVTFTDTVVTAPYRQTYGSSISSYGDYVRFLRGEDTFYRELDSPTSVPVRSNPTMLDQALSTHNTELDDWVAPGNVEIIEIVGTGLPTMKSIEYREITETKCSSAGPVLGQICTSESEIKPYALLTRYGDNTVVQRSAEAYGGEKVRYFVNLVELKKVFITKNFEHYNIAEAPPLQDLLSDILISTTTENNQFISTSHTEFDDPYDIEMIDSPVRLLATDSLGNQTGVVIVDGVHTIKQEIPGSQYFEFGNTKYFVVPKGTDRTTKLYGEDYGGYTLTTAALGANDTQTIRTSLSNASTTPTMIAEYSNENGEFSTVVTDVDGNGVTDYEMTLDGEIINEEIVVTYPLLISTIEELNLSKVRKQALLLLVKGAEYYGNKTPTKPLYRSLEDGLLRSAEELIKLYAKKHYIADVDATSLQAMIQILKDKQ